MKLTEVHQTNQYGRLVHKSKFPITIYSISQEFYDTEWPEVSIQKFDSPEEIEEYFGLFLFNFKSEEACQVSEEYINKSTTKLPKLYPRNLKNAEGVVSTFNKHKSHALLGEQQKFFIHAGTSDGTMYLCIVCTPLEFKKLQKMAWDE